MADVGFRIDEFVLTEGRKQVATDLSPFGRNVSEKRRFVWPRRERGCKKKGRNLSKTSPRTQTFVGQGSDKVEISVR